MSPVFAGGGEATSGQRSCVSCRLTGWGDVNQLAMMIQCQIIVELGFEFLSAWRQQLTQRAVVTLTFSKPHSTPFAAQAGMRPRRITTVCRPRPESGRCY